MSNGTSSTVPNQAPLGSNTTPTTTTTTTSTSSTSSTSSKGSNSHIDLNSTPKKITLDNIFQYASSNGKQTSPRQEANEYPKEPKEPKSPMRRQQQPQQETTPSKIVKFQYSPRKRKATYSHTIKLPNDATSRVNSGSDTSASASADANGSGSGFPSPKTQDDDAQSPSPQENSENGPDPAANLNHNHIFNSTNSTHISSLTPETTRITSLNSIDSDSSLSSDSSSETSPTANTNVPSHTKSEPSPSPSLPEPPQPPALHPPLDHSKSKEPSEDKEETEQVGTRARSQSPAFEHAIEAMASYASDVSEIIMDLDNKSNKNGKRKLDALQGMEFNWLRDTIEVANQLNYLKETYKMIQNVKKQKEKNIDEI
ncbi:uncharacterized protein LODBEIA_P06530 [Lodderomyces beijingensis]|uniref:Uncharacterized protein n=1 Tax=Lodderomyces beijingensis TaxID=1775926 RepID=A0ABP0ZE37_9ASCO